jgi:hypothetical protein
MKNKKLISLDIESGEYDSTISFFNSKNLTWGELNPTCMEIFLKDWTNEMLKH